MKDTCPHQVQCDSREECDSKTETFAKVQAAGARLVKHESPSVVERVPADTFDDCYADLAECAKKAQEGFTAPELTLDRLRRVARRMMALGVR